MAKSGAEIARDYRNRQRGKPPRELQPCGTVAAATRHRRNGEPLDDACRAALADHQARMYANRRRTNPT